MMVLNQSRISCTYKIGGTKTFRLGSSMIFEQFGTNLQNWEKKLRRLLKADLGYILIQIDQAGAEALIVAYLCKDGNYRKLFQFKIKPHIFVALHVFSEIWRHRFNDKYTVEAALKSKIEDLQTIPKWKELAAFIQSSDNWSANERFYYLGKKTVHAGSYGMQASKFILSVLEETGGAIVLERKDAQQFLDNFHSLFLEIRDWHFRVQREYRKTKCLRNLFGFPYQVTDFIGDDFNELYAWIPQSTVGTLTNIACTEFQDYIEAENLDWHLLGNGHDSFLVQVLDNNQDIEKCSLIMKQLIEKEFTSPVDGVKFKMRSEVQVGENWAPYHEKHNPQGLHEIEN